jgi:hypothetical protein
VGGGGSALANVIRLSPSNDWVRAQSQEIADAVEIIVESPQYASVAIDFDVNRNGRIDPNVDVGFGLNDRGGICSNYLTGARSWSQCGVFKSAATLARTTAGNVVREVYRIPKSEIGAAGADVPVRFYIYTSGLAYWVPNSGFESICRLAGCK